MFTLITIPVTHHIWDMPPPRRMKEIFVVREHLSPCAGLFFTAAVCWRARVGAPTVARQSAAQAVEGLSLVFQSLWKATLNC